MALPLGCAERKCSLGVQRRCKIGSNQVIFTCCILACHHVAGSRRVEDWKGVAARTGTHRRSFSLLSRRGYREGTKKEALM